MKEDIIWADIKGYEGMYQISKSGEVKSLDRFVDHRFGGKVFKESKYIAMTPGSNGYLKCNLIKDKVKTTFMIHRLVAAAFILNPLNKPCVNHIDCNKENNNISNLEWVTYAENSQHAYSMGRLLIANKVSSDRMTLLHKQKSKIFKNYE